MLSRQIKGLHNLDNYISLANEITDKNPACLYVINISDFDRV